MAVRSNLSNAEIGAASPKVFARVRTTLEAAYYGNNVQKVTTLQEAYELAKNCSGTVVLDQKVARGEELGLSKDSHVLLFNDGGVTGRNANLRKLYDASNKKDADGYTKMLREAMFNTSRKKMYWAQAYVGLDKDFMVKANLLVPEGYENTLYNWLLNFQICNAKWDKIYAKSKKYDDGEIFLVSDPDQYPVDYKNGIAFFAEEENAGCLLGLRYFGEHKKATLTLAWSMAARHGYTACHGGQKRFDEYGKVIGVFGLSGSGKSTITLSNHGGKLKTTVLHDDAFVISNADGSSVSMEPSYFDKTADYPLTNPQDKFFLTIQNTGVTTNNKGEVVPVTEDVRNGNGRTVKSIFATKNRVYKFPQPCNAIFWIMKDNSLPPVLKIDSPALASAMGATLSTMRSSAEVVKESEVGKLIIEPYANPFRLYKLEKDFNKFKDLFEHRGVQNYIINTGFFLEKKVTKEVTLGLIETIVKDKNNAADKFVPFGPIEHMTYMPIEGFEPDFKNAEYKELIKSRMLGRIDTMEKRAALTPNDTLPEEAKAAIRAVAKCIK